MTVEHPHQQEPARPTLPRVPAMRLRSPFVTQALAKRPATRHRERRHASIAAISVLLLLGVLLSGYAVQSQVSQWAARVHARDMQIARETGAALNNGTVLFVPRYGNMCRLRWIDNVTWKLRGGGEVACDQAITENASLSTKQRKIERRIDAIRGGFQPKP